MKNILFLDRDGTIILEPEDEQIDSLEKLHFYPGVISALRRIVQHGGYELVLVSNQDGLGTASFPEETFWPAHNRMLEILAGEGVTFDAIHIDRSLPEENAPTRKPGTAMLAAYLDRDLSGSYVIGDRQSDVQLAQNLGCRAIFMGDDPGTDVALTSRDWAAISRFLCGSDRRGLVRRTTNETDIRVELQLDGSGQADIRTGLGFFDHMLEQLARHGGMDLLIECRGDLQVDEHHTIEDTALALGAAFVQALGDKKGLQRYGFLLPMDEALAQVAIDFSGRPWLVWQADFKREKVGDVPTEMFFHFFKSFSDAARCTLNIKVDGNNEHHKIEAIFKAWARAIKMAVQRDIFSNRLPSTKGTL